MGFLKKYTAPPLLHVVEPLPHSIKTEKPVQHKPVDSPTLKPVLLKPKPPTDKKDSRILAIEAEAYALGWTQNQLWRISRRYDKKGLADLIKPQDIIAEVTRDWIRLEQTEPNGRQVNQRFYNKIAKKC